MQKAFGDRSHAIEKTFVMHSFSKNLRILPNLVG